MKMHELVDKVVPFPTSLDAKVSGLKGIAVSNSPFEQKVEGLEKWFLGLIAKKEKAESAFQRSVKRIIDSKGTAPLKNIIESNTFSERGLERYFRSHIGLSPKLYSRIIRFSNTFDLVQKNNFKWMEIAFIAGFYDQSHFIKNFKEFTGEEPNKYGFDTKNMANLFLKNTP